MSSENSDSTADVCGACGKGHKEGVKEVSVPNSFGKWYHDGYGKYDCAGHMGMDTYGRDSMG